jgi:hypothetical protein
VGCGWGRESRSEILSLNRMRGSRYRPGTPLDGKTPSLRPGDRPKSSCLGSLPLPDPLAENDRQLGRRGCEWLAGRRFRDGA